LELFLFLQHFTHGLLSNPEIATKSANECTKYDTMIHEVKIQKSASSKKFLDYGIVLHRQKSSLSHSHLQIKSLGNHFQSTSLDQTTDLSSGYVIVGVNNESCRGLTAKQVEEIILRQKEDEVTLLIRGGEVTSSSRGIPGDCVCAKGCEFYCAECCCMIQ
jgi:C-terminal processing protease CtpA/Prc